MRILKSSSALCAENNLILGLSYRDKLESELMQALSIAITKKPFCLCSSNGGISIKLNNQFKVTCLFNVLGANTTGGLFLHMAPLTK